MDSDDDRVEVSQLDRHIPVPEWKRRTNATIKKYNCPTDCLGYGRQRLFGVPGKRTSPLTVVYLFFDFFIITFAVCWNWVLRPSIACSAEQPAEPL